MVKFLLYEVRRTGKDVGVQCRRFIGASDERNGIIMNINVELSTVVKLTMWVTSIILWKC